MAKPPFNRRRPPPQKPDPKPLPDEEVDFEAEVLALLVRSAPFYEQLRAIIAPMVEDLSLGIVTHPGEAMINNEEALGAAAALVVGARHQSNAPTVPTPEVVREMLVDEHKTLAIRQSALLAAAERFHAAHATIDDEATQGKAAEFVRQINAAIKAEEAAHEPAKRPWIDGGKTVQAFFAGLWDPLNREKAKIAVKMTTFAQALAAKQRKEAAEEAARKQREAEEAMRAAAASMTSDTLDEATRASDAAAEAARLAAARPAEHSRVRGDLGAVASLTTRWKVVVENQALLPAQFLMPNDDALKAALKSARRAPDGTPDWNVPGTHLEAEQNIGVR